MLACSGLSRSTPNATDLLVLKDMVEAGTLRPVLADTYLLAETARALRRIEQGRVCGKLVVLP